MHTLRASNWLGTKILQLAFCLYIKEALNLLKTLIHSVVVVVVLMAPGASMADDQAIYVSHDPGGDLGFYKVKAQVARELKLKFAIDGLCASACTLLIGLPPSQVCVTGRARLYFHRARLKRRVANGRRLLWEANRMMFASYPVSVQNWIDQRGGLTDRMLRMGPADVLLFFRRCDFSVHLS